MTPSETGPVPPPATQPAKIRVAHVVDSLAGSGGAENRLVEEIVAIGDRFDHLVVRLFERDFLQGRLEAAGVPVVGLGFQARHAGRSWALAAVRLRSVLRDWRPDVVHTSLFTGNLVGQLASRSLDLPVLSSFNRTGDLELQRALQPGVASWRGRVMQAIARQAGRGADVHYRAVGEYARQTNSALFDIPLDRISVVPRGIEVDGTMVSSSRTDFGLPADGPLIVNVARLVPEKAQHLLVEAFARVQTAHPRAQLAIAGAPGSAEPAVQEAIDRLGVGAAAHLLGFRADARALMAVADVFVLSSVSEGSPGVVLEALALGTPVVAFDIPPVAELTDGGRVARLAPAGSMDGLAGSLLAALGSPDRSTEIAAGQQWARRFDLATVARDLGNLLEQRARRQSAVRVRR